MRPLLWKTAIKKSIYVLKRKNGLLKVKKPYIIQMVMMAYIGEIGRRVIMNL